MSGTILTPQARRLLLALAEPGACAVVTAENGLELRRRRGGIALAGGQHDLAAGEELAAADLAQWSAQAGESRLAITQAGAAWLARRAASRTDDPFLAQHRLNETAPHHDDGPRAGQEAAPVLTRNAAESPLAWLRHRRGRDGSPLLGDAAFAAGERLRADLTRAALVAGPGAGWSAAGRVDGGGWRPDRLNQNEAVLAARQRVRRALEAVGPDFAGLLVDVCGFLKPIADLEAEQNWPVRSGKVILRLALEALARHYGLSDEGRGQRNPRHLAVWRDLDARPVMRSPDVPASP
jgi:hypothetical protein